MFNFIKNLFSGILSFFGGLLSSKKSQDNQSNTPKTGKASGYYMQIDEAEDNQPVAVPQQASSQPLPEKKQKKSKPAKVEASKDAAPPSQPAKVAPAKAPALAASANGKSPQPQPEQTFAPKFLNPSVSSNIRRRPGANMNNFLDMARQAKTPST